MSDSERQRTAASDSQQQLTADDGSQRQRTADGNGGRRRTTGRWPRRLGMVLLGLIIFGSGIVIGSVGTMVVVRRGIVRAVKHPEQIPQQTAQRMARRYDLSEEQTTEIEAILRQRLRRMAAIRQHLRPQIDSELDRLQEDVAEVLSTEQEARWREDFERLRNTIQPPMHAPDVVPDGASDPVNGGAE